MSSIDGTIIFIYFDCSTITSWGQENEADAFRNMLTQFPSGLVAVVSDSYDIWNACDELWGNQLKSQIEMRDGTLVIRPDSGVPHEVVVRVSILLVELTEHVGHTSEDAR